MLMRGVNVGGVRVPMAELAELLRSLGVTEVKTVLQSGNAAFDSDADAAQLKRTIEPALSERFGYDAVVHVYPREDVAAVLAAYPFAPAPGRHSYVVFCADAETARELAGAPVDADAETLAAGTGVVYWQVERGATLKTPFAKLLARPRYRAVTTNRNVNTLAKLAGA